MKALLVVVAIVFAACSGAADEYANAAALAAALDEGGVRCEMTPSETSASLVADEGTCDGYEIYVFDDEQKRDRWLSVGASLGEVVVGPNWAIVSNDGAQDVAEVLDGEIR